MRVICLHEEGYSCNKIAERLKVARRTIQQLVKKYKETGSVKDKPGKGRRKMTTPRDDRVIVNTAIKNRKISSNTVANDF